jgi:hypothetical protein
MEAEAYCTSFLSGFETRLRWEVAFAAESFERGNMAAFKNECQFIRKMLALGDRYDAIFLFLFLVYDLYRMPRSQMSIIF